MVDREKRMQRKGRWEKIRGSKYNRWYKDIEKEGISEYLKSGWKKSRRRRIARFRLRNEMEEGRY